MYWGRTIITKNVIMFITCLACSLIEDRYCLHDPKASGDFLSRLFFATNTKCVANLANVSGSQSSSSDKSSSFLPCMNCLNTSPACACPSIAIHYVLNRNIIHARQVSIFILYTYHSMCLALIHRRTLDSKQHPHFHSYL